MLTTIRRLCNLDVWAQAQSCGVGHSSLVKLERVFSEYNEDIIFFYLKIYRIFFQNRNALTWHHLINVLLSTIHRVGAMLFLNHAGVLVVSAIYVKSLHLGVQQVSATAIIAWTAVK